MSETSPSAKSIKGGRPSKFTPQIAKKVCFLAQKGLIDREICHVLDIAESTLNKWKKLREFSESLKEAKSISDSKVKRSLYERAIGYEHFEKKVFCTKDGQIVTYDTIRYFPPDVTACIFWLKNRQPKEWRDKRECDEKANEVNLSIAKLFAQRAPEEAERLAAGEDPSLVYLGRAVGRPTNGRSIPELISGQNENEDASLAAGEDPEVVLFRGKRANNALS